MGGPLTRVLDTHQTYPLPPLATGWLPVPVGRVRLSNPAWVRLWLACSAGKPIRATIVSTSSISGRPTFTYPLDVFPVPSPPESPGTFIDLFGNDFQVYVQRGTDQLAPWGPGDPTTVEVWLSAEIVTVPSRQLVAHTMASQVMMLDAIAPTPIAGADPYSTSRLFSMSERVELTWIPPGGPLGAGAVQLYGRTPGIPVALLSPILLPPDGGPVAIGNAYGQQFRWSISPGVFVGQNNPASAIGDVCLQFTTAGIAPLLAGGCLFWREFYRTA